MTVHLARKWRSKNFNELVGQDLSVRLLKNSLFKQAFFPAYLFSGLRGSGKTSTARIFAAAINCEQLDRFTKEPQAIILPCGSCISCKALFAGQHPDFIEIDAASHTGVDNMRLIIDSASLLPTLGRKKIYLIDEAHMLSKAAFNAALKILEEPPVHVIFILATTDPEKIIETIKSRCFQLFFDPIPSPILVEHIRTICDVEKITYDDEGLRLIVKTSGGSARDALTTLERVALASEGTITGESVTRVLGLIGTSLIIQLYDCVTQSNVAELLAFLRKNPCDPYTLWKEMTEHIRNKLYDLSNPHEYERALRYLKISYATEQLLAKTAMADAVVEYMLLSMCNPAKKITQEVTSQAARTHHVIDDVVHDSSEKTALSSTVSPEPVSPQSVSLQSWNTFIESLKHHVEPLVITLFSSAVVSDVDHATGRCVVSCLKEHELFKEWLDNSYAIWKPLLAQAFGMNVTLDITFTRTKKSSGMNEKNSPVGPQKPPIARQPIPQRTVKTDLSPTVSQALKIFPGTIKEL